MRVQGAWELETLLGGEPCAGGRTPVGACQGMWRGLHVDGVADLHTDLRGLHVDGVADPPLDNAAKELAAAAVIQQNWRQHQSNVGVAPSSELWQFTGEVWVRLGGDAAPDIHAEKYTNNCPPRPGGRPRALRVSRSESVSRGGFLRPRTGPF